MLIKNKLSFQLQKKNSILGVFFYINDGTSCLDGCIQEDQLR